MAWNCAVRANKRGDISKANQPLVTIAGQDYGCGWLCVVIDTAPLSAGHGPGSTLVRRRRLYYLAMELMIMSLARPKAGTRLRTAPPQYKHRPTML